MEQETISEILAGISEEQQKHIAEMYEKFGKGLKKIAEEVSSEFITEAVPFIFDDLYPNFLNRIRSFISYDYIKYRMGSVTAKEFRKSLLKENYADIVNDLNADLVEEVAKLKQTVDDLQNQRWIRIR